MDSDQQANFRVISRDMQLLGFVGDCVVIEDMGPWDQFMTVTNAVESVVETLFRRGDIHDGQRLFYYDSSGDLDEIVIKDRRAAGFQPGPNRKAGGRMTPDERAEKVRGNIADSVHTPEGRAWEIKMIAAEIRAAVEESKSQSTKMLSLLSYDLGVADGKADAYEDAAKIADDLFHEAGNASVDAPQPMLSFINERMRIARDLASTIRARAAEGSGDGIDSCRKCGKPYLECKEAYQ